MAPPAAMHPMAKYESRKETFRQAETSTAGQSRKKATNSTKLSWPHPIAKRDRNTDKDSSSDDGTMTVSLGAKEYPSPRSMANLGLYFDPTPEEPDRCSLYPEGLHISRWQPGQTALDRLRDEDADICWVNLEMGRRLSRNRQRIEDGKLSWKLESQHLFPTSKNLTEARLKTYGGSWPLDGRKGWKPTSKKLASAGFYYSPNEDEEDCVTCIYCQCSLGGWEKGDDPVIEHQKRRPECPIFISVLEKEVKKIEAKGNKKANTSIAKSRAASRKRAAEDEEEETEEVQVNAAKAQPAAARAETEEVLDATDEEVAKPSAGRKRAPAKPKKASTRKKAAPVNTEETAEKTQPVRKTKKAKTTKDVDSAADGVPPKSDKVEAREVASEILDDAVIDASDFEDEPTRSHDRLSSEKGMNSTKPAEEAKTRDSETFKTPKQTMSGRATAIEKTPKASSPIPKEQPVVINAAAQIGDIAPLTQLEAITKEEKAMTVEDWLKVHVTRACKDMEIEGQKRIAKLQIKMDQGRKQAECILRGIDVNVAT